MSVVLIWPGDVFRVVFCGVFAVATFAAIEACAAAPTPGVLTLKTVDVNAADTVFTYEYAGTPVATFTMQLPVPANACKLTVDGSGWNYAGPKTVDNGDGTFDAHIENSAGATTGKLKVTVTAGPNVIEWMDKVYINLEKLAANPPSLPRYVKVTNRTETMIPKGTVLQFQNRTSLLVSKLVDDLQPVSNVNADGKVGVAYCVVGGEKRLTIENVDKKELAPWLPVAVSGGNVELRMAEAWSFKLKKNDGGTVTCEFIDPREKFAPFPAEFKIEDTDAIPGTQTTGVVFDSAQGTTAYVVWSVSTIPLTVSANATAENWANFLQAFTDNSKMLCKAKNNNKTSDTCGADPYSFYRELLANPLFKARFPVFKKGDQNADNVVAFLQEAERSRGCVDCFSIAMICEPVKAPNGSALDYVLIGETAFKARDYQNAAHAWEHGLVDEPNNGVLLLRMSQASFATQQYNDAAMEVQQAMQNLPKEELGTVVKNYRNLYGQVEDYTNQLRTLEQAVREKPNDPAMRFLLGYHYGFLGYPKEAVTQLKKCTSIAPQYMCAQNLLEIFNDKVPKEGQPPAPSKPPATTDGTVPPPPAEIPK